jgi:glycerophosphoryl diester phosphodiesterase
LLGSRHAPFPWSLQLGHLKRLTWQRDLPSDRASSASGYRPEHTLEAYRLAIELGVDYIEPDLVVTADGELVARHENEISVTTDVRDRPEFADRQRTGVVDGRRVTGWFVEDFTLAELKSLRARERLPNARPSNQVYNDLFAIPTFDEILDLAAVETARLGRQIGVYPEIKQPAYFARIGLCHDTPLLSALGQGGRTVPVYVQSFDATYLRSLAAKITLPLVQLASRDLTMLTPYGLREISTYAQVLGAHKPLIVPRDKAGYLQTPTDLVDRAHDAGLAVHTWTFRSENQFLPAQLRIGNADAEYGDAAVEYAIFRTLGVDGIFTDHPDMAVAALSEPALS